MNRIIYKVLSSELHDFTYMITDKLNVSKCVAVFGLESIRISKWSRPQRGFARHVVNSTSKLSWRMTPILYHVVVLNHYWWVLYVSQTLKGRLHNSTAGCPPASGGYGRLSFVRPRSNKRQPPVTAKSTPAEMAANPKRGHSLLKFVF